MELSRDDGMAILSVLVAISGSFTALLHIRRMRLSRGRARIIWMAAGGASLGLSVWAMHFIGLLASHLPIVYGSRFIVLSVLSALAGALFGFYQLRTAKIKLRNTMFGGLAMGLGFAGMHYLDLAAMQGTSRIVYDPLVFVTMLGIALLAALATPLVVYAGAKFRLPPLPHLGLGGVIMGLVFAAMHYTAMAGTNMAAGDGDAGQTNSGMLALFVALGVFFMLGGGILAEWLDRRMEQQNRQDLAKFQQAHSMAMNMAAELQLVLDSVSQGVVITDTGLHVTYVNGAFEGITGYAEADMLGHSLDILYGDDTSLELRAAMREVLLHSGSFHADLLNYRKDGTPFWNELTISPVRDDREKLVRFVGVLRDVTERRATEQSIREFKTTLDRILDCVFMFDEQTLKFFYINRGAIEQLGYTLEEIAQMHPYDIKPDIGEAQFRDMIAPLLSGELDVLNFETMHRHKDGTRIPVEVGLQLVSVPGERSRFVSVVRDITGRKLAELERERHHDHLQELVDERTLELRNSEAAAHHALSALRQQKFVLDQHAIVAITDVNGRINYANDRFCAISGYSREELMGQDHAMLSSGHHPRGFFRDMYRTVAAGQVWHGEICNLSKDGSLYWVDTTIASVTGSDGKLHEYIAIRSDITERKRAEETANAANRAKSEFLANMSHEIRTPMNGVVGMLDILLESRLTREQRPKVETIRKSALALLDILNDILDFSKIEAGKLNIESIPIPVREVVLGVAQLIPTVIPVSNMDFHVFVSPDIAPWIMSDPVRLRQILFNLVGNALKFSSKIEGRRARVVLRVEQAVREDGGAGLLLHISDNGIGMSQDTLAHLFRNFTQADESTTRRFGGTGLGLAITKRLVEMMGGQIAVRSALGEGTEFTVELSLEEAEPVGVLAAEPDLSGVRVWLLSRDPFHAEFLPAYLRSAGAEVVVVGDVRDLPPQPGADVVMLDPDSAAAGEQIAGSRKRMVQLVRGSSIVNSRAVTVSACPVLYTELLQAVAIASGRMSVREFSFQGERGPELREKAPTAEAAAAAGQLVLLAEDNETNREVITAQLSLLGYASEAAADGRIALEKWRSGRYGLLLTDCHMPNMDGFQLTAAIREEQPGGSVFPIIAVTANAMQGEAQRCLECGMDDYLSKPIRLSELGAMLSKWLSLTDARSEKKLEPDAATHCGAPGVSDELSVPSAAVWDPAMLPRMVGDNPAMHKRLLNRFMDSAEEQVAMIFAAVAVEDARAVAEVAHKLKSAARSVGAMFFGELCQKLETAGRAGDMREIHARSPALAAALRDVSERIREPCA